MSEFVFETIGALVPILVVGGLIAALYAWDALVANYRTRQYARTVSDAARTCDFCEEVKPYALLPVGFGNPLPEWACHECHEFWHPVYEAIDSGYDRGEEV